MALAEAMAGERLAAYVPRIVSAWAVESPATTWQVVDGSLVFVDVSGFTALSERLAKRGAIGAEELTDVISNSFTELLAVAYAEGGSLLKFGGDALLLLFDGDDHAQRACHAAIRMRTTMRRVGRLTTSVGNVRLRMSVGIHTGLVHVFRVGGSHKELIVCGAATSETVTMEGAASAGEILVSPATGAAVDPWLIGLPKGPGLLLRDRHLQGPSTDFPVAADARADAGSAVPVALRAHLQAGSAESEHRQASIAFLHFDGTDALCEKEGAQALADALDELVCDVQRAAEHHGVTFLASDIDHDGGKIILVSGVPRSLGDDEGRLLRAVSQLTSGSRRLRLRIGVNRGPIFAGEVGPPFRRTFTVMGDAVNLAARLMAKAEPGQVLVSEGPIARSRSAFETVALEPFMVKGKARPVQAYALGALRGTQEIRQARRLPLVGRSSELATLEQAWTSAVTGAGRVVELIGDPGVGKTRLIEELRAHAALTDGAQSRMVQCEQYESTTPFFTFRVLLLAVLGLATDDEPGQALEEAVTTLSADLLPWLPLIGDVLDIAIDDTEQTSTLIPRLRRHRTNIVAVRLLAAALRAPTLLIFEDIHWMDDASSDVLARLAATAPGHPWLVCITRREGVGRENLGGPAVTALSLQPLGDDEAERLVSQAALDNPIPAYRRVEIVQRGGGNPLFLEELVRTVTAGGASDDELLPDTVEALLAAAVDDLPSQERQLLRYASVLGATFDLSLLEGVIELLEMDVPAVLVRLDQHLVLEADGRLRFRHRLLRDVAYRTLPYRRRQELHGRTARTIEASAGADADERAAVLSLHFSRAQAWEQAWAYGRTAGDRAREKFANVEATELYQRALDAGRRCLDTDPAELARAWTSLGKAANFAGLFPQASSALREAARLQVGDPVALAELYRTQAVIAQRAGNHVAYVRWIGRGLRVLQDLDSIEAQRARAGLLVLYGSSRRMLGRTREALRWLQAAVEAAKASGNDLALAQAYTMLDPIHLELGQPDLAVHGVKALQLLEDLGEYGEQAILLNNLGAMAKMQGKWSEALSLFQQAGAAFERIGESVYAAMGSCNVAEIFADQGLLEEAEAILREVMVVSRSMSVPSVEALATGHLGRVALRRGNTDEAVEILSQARVSCMALGRIPQVLEIDVLLAEAHLRRSEIAEAVEQLTGALRRTETGGGTDLVPAIRRLLGYAAAAEGRLLDAWAELDASLVVARKLGSQFDVALALEAMSIVAELGGPAAEPGAMAERAEILSALCVNAAPPPPIGGGGIGFGRS